MRIINRTDEHQNAQTLKIMLAGQNTQALSAVVAEKYRREGSASAASAAWLAGAHRCAPRRNGAVREQYELVR
ncbi:hypothetical protein, partial [Salmonella enterica]|uniref:hypothetical protein n=1 Tax=Salmonella enterica TaxID=28901 RepID=UPI00398C6C84